jgi:hypothetical protein
MVFTVLTHIRLSDAEVSIATGSDSLSPDSASGEDPGQSQGLGFDMAYPAFPAGQVRAAIPASGLGVLVNSLGIS